MSESGFFFIRVWFLSDNGLWHRTNLLLNLRFQWGACCAVRSVLITPEGEITAGWLYHTPYVVKCAKRLSFWRCHRLSVYYTALPLWERDKTKRKPAAFATGHTWIGRVLTGSRHPREAGRRSEDRRPPGCRLPELHRSQAQARECPQASRRRPLRHSPELRRS